MIIMSAAHREDVAPDARRGRSDDELNRDEADAKVCSTFAYYNTLFSFIAAKSYVSFIIKITSVCQDCCNDKLT